MGSDVYKRQPFYCLEQPVGIFQRAKHGGNRTTHVLAVIERVDAVLRVARRIGGDKDGLDRVILDQLLKGGIGFATVSYTHLDVYKRQWHPRIRQSQTP